ncbi:MAG: 4-(cytidine 5'-diphospho)-2-C-methyl-D-erythritol kinase [Christensenellaceae bacterium]|jgi:4-diphosphocytidyl-2-C-methyl-D-erythritol kinase
MITGRSYAKINLCLDITGTAENGMHTVDMVMQTVSLYDEIFIEQAGAFSLTAENIELPKENTLSIAAALFFTLTGRAPHVHIHLVKHIPEKAGLGGGSSNGAAVLRMLDKLFDTQLDQSTLLDMAALIGSDAPFFLDGGCMRATGTGTVLSPVHNRCKLDYMLLIKPESGVSTKAAYELYDTLPPSKPCDKSTIYALESGKNDAYFRSAGNALQTAGSILCPEVQQIISECKKKGADLALMTGSGSCIFAVFGDNAALGASCTRFSSRYPFAVEVRPVDFGSEIL